MDKDASWTSLGAMFDTQDFVLSTASPSFAPKRKEEGWHLGMLSEAIEQQGVSA